MMNGTKRSDSAEMLCATFRQLCYRRFYVRYGLAGQELEGFS
jgi:hypothetical protein